MEEELLGGVCFTGMIGLLLEGIFIRNRAMLVLEVLFVVLDVCMIVCLNYDGLASRASVVYKKGCVLILLSPS